MANYILLICLILISAIISVAEVPALRDPLIQFIRRPTLSRQKRRDIKNRKRHKLAAQLLKVQLEQHKIAMAERRKRHRLALKEFDAHFHDSSLTMHDNP